MHPARPHHSRGTLIPASPPLHMSSPRHSASLAPPQSLSRVDAPLPGFRSSRATLARVSIQRPAYARPEHPKRRITSRSAFPSRTNRSETKRLSARRVRAHHASYRSSGLRARGHTLHFPDQRLRHAVSTALDPLLATTHRAPGVPVIADQTVVLPSCRILQTVLLLLWGRGRV